MEAKQTIHNLSVSRIGQKVQVIQYREYLQKKLCAVFGEEFILDIEHICILFKLPEELRRGYFRKIEDVYIDFENKPEYKNIPAWTPPRKAKKQFIKTKDLQMTQEKGSG